MILIVKNVLTNHEHVYRLGSIDGFDEIFDHYPRTHEIALRSHSLEDAAHEIAKYIDQGSRVHAWVVNTVKKSEDDEKTDEEIQDMKDIKLKTDKLLNFKDKFQVWTEKRTESSRGIPRDSTYVVDPGKLRDKKLDIDKPVTIKEKIRDKIEDQNK